MIYVFVGPMAQETVGKIAGLFGEAPAEAVNLITKDGLVQTNLMWRASDRLLTSVAPVSLEDQSMMSVIAITSNHHPKAVIAISTTTTTERATWLLKNYRYELYRVSSDVMVDEIADAIGDEHNLSRMERFHG